ncbi:c-type cytochrome [Agaribacter flavus]|uniref:C-type cytochrome n=2 Tax=Agaribacter flavus TaxID=1902781 RepID=A0ABV7FWQ2_9ALTE
MFNENKTMGILIILTCSFLASCKDKPLIGMEDQGQTKAERCAACHGDNGISTIPIIPNLAGQKAEYTVLQLQAFRSGTRINAAMTPHAKDLSDQDIVDLAAYYAAMDPAGQLATNDSKE